MKQIVKPLLLFLLSGYGTLTGQVVVFSDDISDENSTAWTTTGTIGASAWSVITSGVDWGARRNTSPQQLECTNDASASANVDGYVMVNTPTSDFPSPYNPILANGGLVTWSFNMRQIRTDPAGFAAGNYGVAFILAAETASSNATGSGYAVVLGQSGTTDPVRLVKFTAGILGTGTADNLIVSNTAGLTDFGNQYLSVIVTYNPCLGGQWELFLRNDGTSAFADPLSGSLVSQGTVLDNTHTSLSLNMMTAYWQGSTAANQTAFFDNVTVSVVEKPSASIGASPAVCSGTTTANLPYSNVAGAPNQYSIDYNAAANMAGFVDVPNTALPSSPIGLTVPGAAAPAIYNATITLTNTTTGCSSPAYPFTVTINASPTVTCPGNSTVCSNLPPYALTGGSPSGGTYSGTGVSAGMFNPAAANPGANTITYSYTAMNGCSGACTFTITVNTAPTAVAGTYGPLCIDGPDITLGGTPAGGTWSGAGVTGNMFDPSYGTQTLTYTYTDGNGCTDSDQTTITVTSCELPSTMRWALLPKNEAHGSCVSTSDCDLDKICYGLEYTPLYTGTVTSYTTGFFMDCNNGTNPVITNMSCTMTDMSAALNFCGVADSILLNCSGNTGSLAVTTGIPVILHQVCFTIPSVGVMNITKDQTLGLSLSIDLAGGGFADDTVTYYDAYAVDSSIDCTILPLRWLEFTARPDGDLISALQWSTADEINTSHIEIQRANDTRYRFTTIGRVEADDRPTAVHVYSFVDDQALPGKNYYRLRQVDHDGHAQYSPIRTVSFAAEGFTVKALPNPASHQLTVNIYKAGAPGDISLYDLSGRRVMTLPFDLHTTTYQLPVTDLHAGFYTLVVTSGLDRHIEKLIIEHH